MKLIHTSDWHIGRILNEYSLLDDQAAFFLWFAEEMAKRKPDVILVSGDIYNRSVPPTEAVRLLNQVLATLILDLKIPVVLTAGNHDSKARLSFGNELLEQTGLYIISQPDPKRRLTLRDEYGAVSIHPLPYLELHELRALFPDKELPTLQSGYDALMRSIAEEIHPGERHVLMAHGFFTTYERASADPSVGGEELIRLPLARQFTYTALGHIHRPSMAGEETVRYCGSPLKYALDDTGDRCFLEVTLGKPGTKPVVEPVWITPRHELRSMTGTFASFLQRDITKEFPADDYYFFHLTDNLPVPDAMLQLKAVYPNLLGLTYDHTVQAEGKAAGLHDLKNRSLDELLAQFYEEETGEPMTRRQTLLAKRLLDHTKNILSGGADE